MTPVDLAARTLAELRSPWWRRAALAWFVLTCALDLAVVRSHSPETAGTAGTVGLIIAVAIGALLLLAIAAALLRRASASPRSPWRIDGAFLLYVALHVALAAALWLLLPPMDEAAGLGAGLLVAAVPLLLALPLAPWLVAVAVERPLAISPWPFIRRADSWLPPLLLLTLTLLLPLSLAQFWLSWALVEPGRAAIELGLAHALLSTLAEMASLALALVAYRSVAED